MKVLDTNRKHLKNGLLQNKHHSRSGFTVTANLVTGIGGEVYSLSFYDHNIYQDSDSRSESPNEFLIPFDSIKDWISLRNILDYQIKESEKTLIKPNNDKLG